MLYLIYENCALNSTYSCIADDDRHGEDSVTQTWTLIVEEEPVTPEEPSTPLDLTVQQIAMAVVLAGLIPLIIVSVMLLNGMDGFKNIAPDKITIALVVICVMLILTVLIINPIANLI